MRTLDFDSFDNFHKGQMDMIHNSLREQDIKEKALKRELTLRECNMTEDDVLEDEEGEFIKYNVGDSREVDGVDIDIDRFKRIDL